MTTTWLRRAAALGAVAVLALTAGVLAHPDLTRAAWTDPEYAAGTLTATSINAPTISTCTGGYFTTTATLGWTAPTSGLAPARYRYVLGSVDTTVASTTTSATVTAAAAGGNGTYTLSVYALTPAGTVWTSPAATASVTYGTILGFISYVQCTIS